MTATATPEARAIGRALAAIGLEADSAARERLMAYAREAVRWTRRVDLTGATTALEFIEGPLFDALTAVPLLSGLGTVADVGSGGGLPGVPLLLVGRGVDVTLVEPRARRAAFLRHVVAMLDLDACIVQGRDEEIAPASFHAAVSQAVWPAVEWLRRARRIVIRGGAICVLGTEVLDESTVSAGAAIETRRRFVRPRDGAPRHATLVRLSG